MAKQLNVDETRKFDTPLYKNVVRTGTVGDGSCLFHAVMYLLSQNYLDDNKEYNPEKYKELALDLRDKIADSFTLSDFSNLQNKNLSIILMHEMLQTKI